MSCLGKFTRKAEYMKVGRRGIPYLRLRRKLCHLAGDERGVAKWTKVIHSARVVDALKEKFNDRVHPSICFEITAECNYRCKFCPQSSRPRERHHVTREHFDLFISRLEECGYKGDVLLNVNNEPFTHPDLMMFCEKLSARLPAMHCHMYTNGSLVRREHIEFLSSLPVTPSICVDDYTDNHSVAARLEEAIKTIGSMGRMRFEIKLRSRKEVLSNRAGNQPNAVQHPEDFHQVACTWPFFSMFLSPDLRAYLCCSDYDYEVILGDLKEQKLMDIWASPAYRGLRERMLSSQRRDIPLCSRCDAESSDLPPHVQQG